MTLRFNLVTLLTTLLLVGLAAPALAQPPGRDRDDNPPGPRGGPGTNWENRPGPHGGPGASHDRARHWRHPVQRGRPVVVPPGRMRSYRGIYVVRPHGHWYPGYGRFYRDDDALAWLAFTAITLALLDNLSEAQERAHEQAQVAATSAPIGETIRWSEGGASGSVVALREGTSTTGRYCREFQQTVTIGGRSEEAYGTACQQPDGTWEIVSTQN